MALGNHARKEEAPERSAEEREQCEAEKFPARPLGLLSRGGEPYGLEEVIAAIVESLALVETRPPSAEAKEEIAA